MKRRCIAALKRYEIYVVSTVIGVVFAAAMVVVAWMLQSSIVTPPYETLSDKDMKRVFTSGYLRFREDDKSPYLKVELHNGTMWWIKKIEFEFDGIAYVLRESDAFRPMHFGAVRCPLRKAPKPSDHIEFDIKLIKASGYPPAQAQLDRESQRIAGQAKP
ncbi:MAG: hypothetical protein HY912_17900 [Desulfomonile tiedjei]|uniref:Uncharacterized protein n=1 Tax=Desulfomonile tiedjei TaxID=2358 RepID=A0A9D6V7G4_9BACT|nr:hypothetical protein [Desulfomonile tiedjei]